MKSVRCNGKQLGQRGLLLVLAVGQDQPLDVLAALAQEHVLGAAQADALAAETTRTLGVFRGVGVGLDTKAPLRVCVYEDAVDRGDQRIGVRLDGAFEVLHDRTGDDRYLAEVDDAGGAVDRDDVAFLDHLAIRAGELTRS